MQAARCPVPPGTARSPQRCPACAADQRHGERAGRRPVWRFYLRLGRQRCGRGPEQLHGDRAQPLRPARDQPGRDQPSRDRSSGTSRSSTTARARPTWWPTATVMW
jgi:hypothetical protein